MEFKTVRQELDAFYKIASKNFKRANISNTAIVIAYYTLVAIFPMVIFIGNILPLLHIKASEDLALFRDGSSKAVYTTLEPLLETF